MKLTEQEAAENSGNHFGYCTECDDITTDGGVEPDADGYECDQCGNDTVKGIEQAVIDGDIQIVSVRVEDDEDGE